MLCVLAGAALLQKKSQPTFLPPADYKRAVIDRELCVSYYIYVSHECIDVTKNDHSFPTSMPDVLSVQRPGRANDQRCQSFIRW